MGWKSLTAIVAFFGAMLGVIVAFPKAYEVAEPFTPATSRYVRHYADTTTTAKIGPFQKRLDENEILRARDSYEMARVLLNQQQQYLFAAQKEMELAPTSSVIRDRIAALQDDIVNTQARIKAYQAAPAGRRD